MEESSNGNVKEVNDKVFDREAMVDENSDVVVKKLTGGADMNNSTSSSSSSSDDEEIDEQNNPASVEEVEERILLPVVEEEEEEEQILIPVLKETVEEVEPEFEKLELPDVPQSDSKEKDVGHSDTLVKETKDLLIRNLQENDGIAVSTGGTEEAEPGENEENAKTLDDKSRHIGSSKFGEPSSNTVDDLSYSAATEHGNHPQVPPNPPLISLRQHHTSWMSCCGMLGLLRRSNS